jgi:hypothetical protein
MRLAIIILFILSTFFFSCNKQPESVNEVLQLAGNNRHELEKVILHYKKINDYEKLEAAYFLIGNMHNKFGRYGTITKKYEPVFKRLKDLYSCNINIDTINKIIKKEWDSIDNIYGGITYDNMPYKYDYNVITSELLIENIDMSFKVWKEKPWAKHVNFNQFCEFILPYRIYDEPLQQYRKAFFNEFSWLDDSLKGNNNPIEACKILNRYFASNFIFCSKLDGCPILGAFDMLRLKAGICEHRYFLVASVMRSIGLPVGIDFTPQWNFGAGQHSWLVLFNNNNQIRPFNGGDFDSRLDSNNILVPVSNGTASKVYRILFSDQKNSLMFKINTSHIPELFQITNLEDVTEEYNIPQTNIKFVLTIKPPDSIKYAFLNCFGYSDNLVPIAYSKIKSACVEFYNIGLNGVYLPTYFKNNKLIIASNPNYFSSGSLPISLSPDLAQKKTVKLYRKYPPQQYLYRMKDYVKWMIGAKFQAANNDQFNNPVTLYTIDSSYYSYVERKIIVNNSYRYYRYISSDTGSIRLADVDFKVSEFKNIRNKSKIFKIFGETSKYNIVNNSILKNAFDGDISTNFNALPGSWVAIDFGKPVLVDKISFLVRNDLNVIEIGDFYELLYFNLGWVSLGYKKAENNYIVFENVPDHALLLLKDITKGKDERVFIYKDGNQEWLED